MNLDELERLAKTAELPWEVDDWGELRSGGVPIVHCSSAGDAWVQRRSDAALIVSAVNAVPDLVAATHAATDLSNAISDMAAAGRLHFDVTSVTDVETLRALKALRATLPRRDTT